VHRNYCLLDEVAASQEGRRSVVLVT